jgi:hypothetical protein
MVLQQCAHFYNTIATEMIPCQRPLMLADAVEFEKVGNITPKRCGHRVYVHVPRSVAVLKTEHSGCAAGCCISCRHLREDSYMWVQSPSQMV